MSKPYKASNKASDEVINLDFVNPQYPIDSTAERALVAALIDAPHKLSEVWGQLGSVEVLGNEAYRIILKTISDLIAEDKPAKLSTMLQRLNKSGETKILLDRGVNLMDLQREAASSDILETCIYLRGLWVKRMAVDSVNDIRSAVVDNQPVDVIADKAAKLHEVITSGLTVGADKSMSDFIGESLRKLERAMSKPGTITGVETGLKKLNKHLGGWQNTDVIMIAGRPGMGKSVCGVFHAYEAAKAGTPVAFLSLEMAASSLVNRLISNQTDIPYSDIVKGYVTTDQVRTIHQAAGQIENLPIHWYDEPERDIADLGYKLLDLQRKHGIGLVIIDYVQLIEDRTVKSTNEYEILTSVSKKLKKLQRRLKCPLIELAQLSRAVESRDGRRGKPSDLKSTGQYEQDASIIIMPFREDQYAEEAAQEEAKQTGRYVTPVRNHKFEYGIVKNRDGYTGTVMLHADVALNQVFDEAPSVSQFDTAPKPASTSFPSVNLSGWGEPLPEAAF